MNSLNDEVIDKMFDSGYWFFVPPRSAFAEFCLWCDIQEQLEGDDEE